MRGSLRSRAQCDGSLRSRAQCAVRGARRYGSSERRTAHFHCAVALCHPDGEELTSGTMPGRITRAVRGTGGVGYGVLFEADDRRGLTTAELSVEDKDAISHRGWARRRMAPIAARILR